MKNVLKAVKILEKLNEEEKAELSEYFTKEEEKEEEKKETKEKTKTEEKTEKKEEKKEDNQLLGLLKEMNLKIESLEEKVKKSTPFGAKKKTNDGKETSEFEDIFNKLSNR